MPASQWSDSIHAKGTHASWSQDSASSAGTPQYFLPILRGWAGADQLVSVYARQNMTAGHLCSDPDPVFCLPFKERGAMSNLIGSAFSSLMDQMPGVCACKDAGSIFLYGNSEFKKSMGLDEDVSLRGLRHLDLPAGFGSYDDSYVEQDKFVIETGGTIRSINVYHAADQQVKAYLVVKKPFFDVETHARGVLMHGTDITHINGDILRLRADEGEQRQRLSRSMPRGTFVIKGSEKALDLTRRETEVLFYLLRGGVARRIANLLSISVRTVEHHIDALKDKFMVASKPELIEKAIQMGYFYITPATLFGPE
ncbi:PAS and helix-turn-helix domain-containing protein [Paraburkholderia phenazinium]|uniref:PAS and helix-turn-helix domain-containing protein n=1 Tax=Paraburkholderia phenazinium TaxID=60549 RepID=UPI00158AC404|nr:PAS and helix-turn-helix domain-containing protein [Paraburkholderia phenazinium]